MRAALDKCVTGMCTEKPVAIDKSTATGKTEQRKTEQRKTEERKTQNKETGARRSSPTRTGTSFRAFRHDRDRGLA